MFEKFLDRGKNYKASRECTSYLFKVFFVLGFLQPRKWKYLYYLYAILQNFIVLFLFPVLFILSYFYERAKMNTSQLLNSLQVSINVCGLPAKVITILIFLKTQVQAMDAMDTLDARCQRQEEREKIRHCALIGNRLTAFYTVFYGLYSVVTFITSIILGQPPYSLYMPIMDWRNSTTKFTIQSLIEFSLMNFVVLHEVGCDVYAVIYIYAIRTHLNILVERVGRLGSDSEISKDEHYEQLVNCVKDHQNLLSLLDIISPVISITMFIQFTITAAILGTTLINILVFADTYSQIPSVIYLLCVLFQSTLCCYQATCLMEDNEQLSLALFHCEWFDKDKRFRKMLRFFIMRSQTPIILTALKLFYINLSTSVGIAKFSFSLYTLIEQMDFGQNFKQ